MLGERSLGAYENNYGEKWTWKKNLTWKKTVILKQTIISKTKIIFSCEKLAKTKTEDGTNIPKSQIWDSCFYDNR